MKKQDFMMMALDQARSFQGLTQPNPAVGAVVVREGQVLSVGAHQAVGGPHAEVHALSTDASVEGAELYVTLEPCCHHGRTPPCTDLIIDKKIKTVYFSYFDPNPQVAGQGQQRLQSAGIECIHLPLDAVTSFYKYYAYWVTNSRAWITLKLALTNDGFISSENKKPLSITGPKANLVTHQGRYASGALLTSVETIINDDPQFNVRLTENTVSKPVFVLDRLTQLPLNSQLLKTAQKITLFCAHDAPRITELEGAGIQCVAIDEINGHLDLDAISLHLARFGYHNIWVEVGARYFQAWMQSQSVCEVLIFVSHAVKALKGYPVNGFALPGIGRHAEVSVTDFEDDTLFQFLLGSSFKNN
jgi:diaminohydroxyphosphoribosylaminopyrimidine deaminase / 5-amino-6-(5-phosphoribosylamino)uracil reductase